MKVELDTAAIIELEKYITLELSKKEFLLPLAIEDLHKHLDKVCFVILAIEDLHKHLDKVCFVILAIEDLHKHLDKVCFVILVLKKLNFFAK